MRADLVRRDLTGEHAGLVHASALRICFVLLAVGSTQGAIF